MTLLQLKYLLELAHYESFSLASKKNGISQPALSLQIGKLEEELGIILFKRSPQKISLTSDGELFAEKARELINLSEKLKELPFEMEQKPVGELKIGVIPTLAPYWFPMFLHSFSEKYPLINLTVKELKTEEIIMGLKNGWLDGGYFSTPVDALGLVFEPLFYEKFFLYVSKSHELYKTDTINLNEIDLKGLWYLQEGNCFQNQVDSICIFSREPNELQNVVYLSNSIESLCRMVENSGGMTFIPELSTLSISGDQEEMIKEIEGSSPTREISLVTTKFSKSDRLLEIFTNEALSVIPKRMKSTPSGKTIPTYIKHK
jgi:LysR family transcriptional regulator, hydrogen peroxide-inducible genes activator